MEAAVVPLRMGDGSLVTVPPPLGSAARWSADLALVGAVSCFLAPAAIIGSWAVAYAAIAGGLGAVTGGLLGPVLRRLFAGPLGRAKVGPLLLAGLGVGAGWGALVASAAVWMFGLVGNGGSNAVLPVAAALGAVAGAAQLGWFWLPYLIRRARGRSVWPILAGAALLSPALGYLGFGVLRLFGAG